MPTDEHRQWRSNWSKIFAAWITVMSFAVFFGLWRMQQTSGDIHRLFEADSNTCDVRQKSRAYLRDVISNDPDVPADLLAKMDDVLGPIDCP